MWSGRRLLVVLALLLPGWQARADEVLGQIPADYELHGELVLLSGQLEGFSNACGFGRKPDRGELMTWYEHHRLARNPARMQVIYDLGVSLGREGPCTADHYQVLEAHWYSLMTRTQQYVENYR
ncbi:MAG TPA: hypothetical protein VEB20_23360 [Azospirillaceae bacterium]|nr:hypothetical protein [Azospirillaceae bacterium]